MPSLHPSSELIGPFIEGAVTQGFTRIIVVDDGSGPGYAAVFDDIAQRFGVTVLRHSTNRGKGRAIKTAIEHIAQNEPSTAVIVTADSDGQHAPGDLVRVVQRALDDLRLGRPTVVLGVRTFEGESIPPKSKWGNKATSAIVRLLFGRRLADTQTGLRAFPLEIAAKSALVVGERFDYEMNVLLWLLATRQSIDEVPIDTIYHDLSNSVSHFRPIVDSTRVYAVILRQFLKFSGASIASAVVDLAVYVVLLDFVFASDRMPSHIAIAVVVARVVSSVFNFSVNKWLVFHDTSAPAPSFARYALLAGAILAVSALATTALSVISGGHVVWAKIVVDGTLFVASYVIQERWVFRDQNLTEARSAQSGSVDKGGWWHRF